MSYADYNQTANHLVFYRDLDSFGVSHFLTFQPDIAAYYKEYAGLDIAFYTSHWRSNNTYPLLDYRIWIDPNPSDKLSLHDGALYSINGRMSVKDQSALNGYLYPTPQGREQFDDDYLRTVWEVSTVIHDSGYVLYKPTEGIFPFINNDVDEQSLTMDCQMRLLSTGLDDDVIVARIAFTNWRVESSTACILNGDSRLLATRLNDTLLILGRPRGTPMDTVSTIDRTLGITKSPVVFDACDKKNHLTIFNPTNYTNVCYEGDTTTCVFPWRYVKEIRAGDFPDTTDYHTFSLDCIMSSGKWSHYLEIEFTDKGTIRIDSISVSNHTGRHFDSTAVLHASDAALQIQQFYNSRVSEPQNIAGIYSIDEPYGMQMQTLERVKKILTQVGQGYPKNFLTTLGDPNTLLPGNLHSHFFDTYIRYTQEPFFLTDAYHNYCMVTSSSEVAPLNENWQYLMDTIAVTSGKFEPSAYAQRFRFAQEQVQSIRQWSSSMNDYWAILPSWTGWEKPDTALQETHWKKRFRFFTGPEMRAVVNMALVYGAKGIGYWPYLGHLPRYSQNAPEYDRDAISIATSVAQSLGIDDYPAAALEQLDEQVEICETDPDPQFDLLGIVRYDDQLNVQRSTEWYQYRDINRFLDSMAFFFNNAEWKSAAPWTEDLASLSGSFVDSIRSTATYDSAYLHVGFFELAGEKYAYVFNRRVDSMNYSQIDSQTVHVHMSGEGMFELWGMYEDGSASGLPLNFCDTIYDSCGQMIHSQFLGPGRSLLLRLRQLKKYWRGTLATNETWPSFATIRLTGDLTVPAGKTLTIQGGRSRIQSYVDSSHAGLDVNRTEINVYGTLRAEAPAGDSIVISPQTYEDTARAAWRGIRVFADGKVYLNRVRVRGAVTGLETQHTEVDTVLNSRFENCLSHGIHSILAPLYLHADTFVCHDTLALTDYGLRIDGPHGNIEIEEEVGGEGGGEDYFVGGGGDGGMIINGVGPGRTVVDVGYCVFKEVKYPIYAIGARPTIDHCKFNCAKAKGGATPAAIHIDTNSVATVSYSELLNYGTGIRVDRGTSVTVTRSSFSSTHFWSDNHGPSMYVGIDADSAAYSTCTVRSCCFFAIDDRSVVSDNNIVDLGNLFDAGHNNFFIDIITAEKAFPKRFIVNNFTDTLQAMGNYFAVSGGVDGPVDTSFSYSMPDLFCEEPISGEFKLASPADESSLPRSIEVGQNYPNPFNPVTEIRYYVPTMQHVRMDVLNVLGQVVSTLVDAERAAGEHSVIWDARDASGLRVASGIYLYRFVAGDYHVTKKMILLK